MNAIKGQILQAELSEQCQSPGSALRLYRLHGSQQLMPYGPADPIGCNQQIAQTQGGKLVDRGGQQLSQGTAGTDPGLTLR